MAPVNSDEPVFCGVCFLEVSQVKVLVSDHRVPGPVISGGSLIVQLQVAETVVRQLVHLMKEKFKALKG